MSQGFPQGLVLRKAPLGDRLRDSLQGRREESVSMDAVSDPGTPADLRMPTTPCSHRAGPAEGILRATGLCLGSFNSQ